MRKPWCKFLWEKKKRCWCTTALKGMKGAMSYAFCVTHLCVWRIQTVLSRKLLNWKMIQRFGSCLGGSPFSACLLIHPFFFSSSAFVPGASSLIISPVCQCLEKDNRIFPRLWKEFADISSLTEATCNDTDRFKAEYFLIRIWSLSQSYCFSTAK